MTNKDALKQGEQTLGQRIEHKADNRTTDVKLFDEILTKTCKFGDLVAVHHAEVNRLLSAEREYIRKIKVALAGYRKAIKK